MASALAIVRQFFPDVQRVNDADEPVMFKVTKRDQTAARKKDRNECAAAVACKRQFGLRGVIISRSTAYLVRERVATRYHLPPSTEREVVSFDRNAGFASGTYQLSAVPKAARQGEWRGESTTSGKSHNGNLKKRFRHLTAGVRTVLGGQHAPEQEDE